MATPFLDECLSVLTRTPRVFDALLRDLPEGWTSVTEGAGTWSPYAVTGHLIHAERADWMPRLDIILKHGPARPFDPFDGRRSSAIAKANRFPRCLMSSVRYGARIWLVCAR